MHNLALSAFREAHLTVHRKVKPTSPTTQVRPSDCENASLTSKQSWSSLAAHSLSREMQISKYCRKAKSPRSVSQTAVRVLFIQQMLSSMRKKLRRAMLLLYRF